MAPIVSGIFLFRLHRKSNILPFLQSGCFEEKDKKIRRAAKKIKQETAANIDYGFKHYIIKDLDINTLDKLEKFEPNWIDQDKTILDEFGINSVLTTWMNYDGYELSDCYEVMELEDYKAYKCNNTIY